MSGRLDLPEADLEGWEVDVGGAAAGEEEAGLEVADPKSLAISAGSRPPPWVIPEAQWHQRRGSGRQV